MRQLALGAVLTVALRAADAVPCPSPDVLTHDRYTVSKVSVRTPLSFSSPMLDRLLFAALERAAEARLDDFPIKAGQTFSREAYNQGQHELLEQQERQNAILISPSFRVRVAVIVPGVTACTAPAGGQPGTVEVVYKLFTSDAAYFASQIFESKPEKAARSLAAGLLPATPRVSVQPFTAYNAARGMFGGGLVSTSLGDAGRLNVFASAGNGTFDGTGALAGDKDFDGPIAHVEWASGVGYSVLPAGAVDLVAAPSASNILRGLTAWGRFAAGTSAAGPLNLIGRAGFAFEAGHRQADNPFAPAIPDVVPNASYGAIKTYGGATFNHGRYAFSGTAGLQLGKAPDSLSLGYMKAVGDLGFRGRLLAKEHYPIRIDADFNGGRLFHVTAPVPLADRFFGGNAEQPFIPGDPWRVRNGPFIRGIPQNRLGYSQALGAFVGGHSFVSTNLTVAPVVWAYPGILPEIRHDPDFHAGIINNNKLVLKAAFQDFIGPTTLFQKLLSDLGPLDRASNDYRRTFDDIRATGPASAVIDLIDRASNLKDEDNPKEFLDPLHDIAHKLELMRKAPRTGFAVDTVVNLVADPTDSALAKLANAGDAVAAALDPSLPAQTAKLRALGEQVRALAEKVRGELHDAQSVTQPDDAALLGILTAAERIEKALTDISDRASNFTDSKDEKIGPQASVTERAADAASGNIPDPDDTPRDKALKFDALVSGLGKVVPPLAEAAASEADMLAALLAASGQSEDAAAFRTSAGEVREEREKLQAMLAKVERPEAFRWAARQTTYFRNTIDVLAREFNVAAVSPVFVYDTAKLWAEPQAQLGGLFHSVGFGARLSLATADFTLGYAWTIPSRLGRGALFFSLDITDLFR